MYSKNPMQWPFLTKIERVGNRKEPAMLRRIAIAKWCLRTSPKNHSFGPRIPTPMIASLAKKGSTPIRYIGSPRTVALRIIAVDSSLVGRGGRLTGIRTTGRLYLSRQYLIPYSKSPAEMTTLLNALRKTSQVDCDTLDSNVAHELGPFADCTSNQAIAFSEISRPLAGKPLLHHDALIKEAIRDARQGLNELQGSAVFEEFVVQILMVKLQLLIVPNVTGYVHIQTNPKLSYSTAGTISDAERIVNIFKGLAPDFDAKRVCIKIPATWEGLQACRALEVKGIATLATTMFCMEQAALAAEAQCTYIAPYVTFDFCREAQAYYTSHSFRTQVLAASLTSVDEVMQLAMIQHITISPNLLNELASADLSAWKGKLGEYFAQGPANKSWETRDYNALVKDESAWKLAFTRSGFGTSEGKIIQAINYFSDFQEKLEELVKQYAE
ncbi:hypothetical protein F66182_2073 [Fusarium sp. NRRL 66182]|nr:hypothetical protein F66182_2073 [Fusarium sp. NRRL 66182]